MARSHDHGDRWDNPHDGVGRAGERSRPHDRSPESTGHTTGQQAGSKRPATRTGSAKRAPKKGEKGD